MTEFDVEHAQQSDEFDLRNRQNGSKGSRNLIPVIYCDSSPGMVDPEVLEDLIQRRRIISFRRSNEWVRIKGDPIREKACHFTGTDRRSG